MNDFRLYCTTDAQLAALRDVGIEAIVGMPSASDSVVYRIPMVYFKRGHPVRAAYVADDPTIGGQWIIGTYGNGLPILTGSSVSRWIDNELESAGICRKPYKGLNHIQPLPLPG